MLPSTGTVIAAQPAALLVNGIATPWDEVVLDTVSLRVTVLLDPYAARRLCPAGLAACG